MSINFDTLPKDKPAGGEYPLPKEGFRKAKITVQEMKTPLDTTKKDYLNLTLELSDGKVWDKIFDSEAPVLLHKIYRLALACKLPIAGSLTLPDIGKLLVGKEVVVDIKHDIYTNRQGVEVPTAGVDIFSNDIYYPIEAFNELTGAIPDPANGEDIPTLTTNRSY